MVIFTVLIMSCWCLFIKHFMKSGPGKLLTNLLVLSSASRYALMRWERSWHDRGKPPPHQNQPLHNDKLLLLLLSELCGTPHCPGSPTRHSVQNCSLGYLVVLSSFPCTRSLPLCWLNCFQQCLWAVLPTVVALPGPPQLAHLLFGPAPSQQNATVFLPLPRSVDLTSFLLSPLCLKNFTGT